MKRLAFYSTIRCYGWGAPDYLWSRAAEAALKRGDAVLAVLNEREAMAPAALALRDAGAEILPVPPLPPRGRREWLRNLLSGRKLSASHVYKTLRRFKPDMLFINQGGTYDFLLEDELRKLISRAGVPYAILCHHNEEIRPMSDELRHRAVDFFASAARVFWGSPHIRSLAERQLAAAIAKSEYFQSPVEVEGQDVVPWPSAPPWSLAVVSRLHSHEKGLDLLLEALAVEMAAEPGWRLRIYGEGPDENYLRALVARLGLTSRVEFMGFVADKEKIWAENHLLLLPSRIEGCGLAMVEAMLCGRPVLRTKLGGAEWLRDGVSGFLCEAATSELLGRSLRIAWQNRERWETMGAVARTEARTRSLPHPESVLLSLVGNS